MNENVVFDCSSALNSLDTILTPDQEIRWREHVASCPICLSRVESSIGDFSQIDFARKLRTDELDAELEAQHEFSTTDFVVEFLEPANAPEFLGSIGNYDVASVIGRGGMGIVLKAFDRDLRRYVAVKVLSPHLASQPMARKRFAREAQAAAAVVHLNVIPIYHVQPSGRLPFFVMPIVGGEPLSERLQREGSLKLEETLRIGMQTAAGLAAAHEQGLVHRDIKPSNILLEKGVERAVLTDFGLARAVDDISLTRTNAIIGTPEFMSPEAARGEPVDMRSDLFSLGCVLYTMASGVSPFRANSTMAALRQVSECDPQSLKSHCPELPSWFISIVGRLLSKDPNTRPQTAEQVEAYLEQGLAHLQRPSQTPAPSLAPSDPQFHFRPVIANMLVVCLLIIPICFTFQAFKTPSPKATTGLQSQAAAGEDDTNAVVPRIPRAAGMENSWHVPGAVEAVDLSEFYGITANRFDTIKQFPWSGVPRGRKVIEGVPFQIGGAINLWGASNAARGLIYPEQIKAIPIGRQVQSLYLLHCAFFEDEAGQAVFEVVFNYEDDSAIRESLRFGEDSLDWFVKTGEGELQPSDARSKLAWRGFGKFGNRDQEIRFCLTEISNPNPEKILKSIDLFSAKNKSATNLLAISVKNAIDVAKVREAQATLSQFGAKIRADEFGSLVVDIRNRSDFTDQHLDLLLECGDLDDLTLESVAITDAGIEKLRPFVNLRRLVLNRSKISGAGIKALAGMPLRDSILSIGLSGCKVRDEDSGLFENFSTLERLDVSETAVTDAAVNNLAKLKLQMLNVTNTAISEEKTLLLRERMPNTNVTRE